MKLSFNLKGRRQTDSTYTVVKTGMPDAQWQLYVALLSASLDESFCQDQASGKPIAVSVGEHWVVLREKIRDNDPAFVARLAVYLREKMNLRTLSFVVSAELAASQGDREWIASLVGRVLHQAAEIPESLYPGRPSRDGCETRPVQIPDFQIRRRPARPFQTGQRSETRQRSAERINPGLASPG